MKFEMIRQTIAQRIYEGVYPADDAIPSERTLAAEFGVSRTTVRQALQDMADKGILYPVRGSGYYIRQPDLSAKRIGVLVSGNSYSEIFAEIMNSMRYETLTRELGFELRDASSEDTEDCGPRALEMAMELVRLGVCGVIFQPVEFSSEAERFNRLILACFEKAHLPVVLLDCAATLDPNGPDYDLVSFDNFRAGYLIGERLAKRGARQIRFLAKPAYGQSIFERIRGLRTSRPEAASLWIADPTDRRKIAQLIKKDPTADAIVCQNDLVAADLIKTLNELGYSVPQDYCITGFDDVRIAAQCKPPLTSVRQPIAELARCAVEALCERMADPERCVRIILVAGPIIERESSRIPNPPKK